MQLPPEAIAELSPEAVLARPPGAIASDLPCDYVVTARARGKASVGSAPSGGLATVMSTFRGTGVHAPAPLLSTNDIHDVISMMPCSPDFSPGETLVLENWGFSSRPL